MLGGYFAEGPVSGYSVACWRARASAGALEGCIGGVGRVAMWDVRDRMAVLQVGQKGEWDGEWEGDSAGEKIQSSVSGRTVGGVGGLDWGGRTKSLWGDGIV